MNRFAAKFTLNNSSRLILLIFFTVIHSVSFGAIAPKVSMTADTNQIRIGEQIKLNLKAVASKGTAISFPVVGDTIHGLEIVNKSKVDTISGKDSDTLSLAQQITVTCFDTGYFVIEPFSFVINGKDTLYTEAQLIGVTTIPIDTTKAFKDIKTVMEPPFDWREWLPYLIGLAILIILAVIGYFFYRKWKNKPVIPVIFKQPVRPAHEIALEALKLLEHEKLWQQGAFKEYHIRLTDIIRTYIDNRYQITSMEFTTDETLQALRRISLNQELLQSLEQIFRLADLVKFAKSIPVGPENEQALTGARNFIQVTALIQNEEEEKS